MIIQNFKDLTIESKIDLLVRAQSMMIAKGKPSPFLATANNLEEYKQQLVSLVQSYKGILYEDSNNIALFKYIQVEDVPINKMDLNSIAAKLKQESEELFNAISIDFLVSDSIYGTNELRQALWKPSLKYIIFVRHGNIKVYEIPKLLSSIINGA